MKVRLRKDKYQGWQVTVGGCPHPAHSLKMVYLHIRRKGWNRRVSASVAMWTVLGWWDAFHYASGCGYPSSMNATSRSGR